MPRTPLNAENNPGNARWCDEHGRLECTKNRNRGRGPCHGMAIRGLNQCRIHSGFRSEVAKAKGEARVTAWSALGDASQAVSTGAAVLGMLHMTWLRAAAYGELLRQQVVTAELDEPDVDGLQPGTSEHTRGSGLIGYRYGAAGKEGHVYATNEEIRALVQLEAQERDRVVRFAKTAHDMGISERMTSLAESWGDAVASRIMLIMAGLNLTAEQESLLPGLIETHLASVEVGEAGTS